MHLSLPPVSPWESIFIVLGFVQLASMPKPAAVNGNLGGKKH